MLSLPETNRRRGSLLFLLAGFAAAALLTLAAAIGTSMWQRVPRAGESSTEAPVAQK